MDLNKLKTHIESCKLSFINKNWIDGRLRYEAELSNAIGGQIELDKIKSRYWDCCWNEFFIELKLGKQGAWFNLVRYSEIYLDEHPVKEEVITLCMKYDYDRNQKIGSILTIYFLETSKLIKKLGLNKRKSKQLLKIREKCPRDFNAQANLTYADVSEIATTSLDFI